jgi:outer membrane protein insertion porin family
MRSRFFLKFFIFIFLSFFIIVKSYASNLEKITISGNSRITYETIITFLPVRINDNIDDIQINEITKDLYETNFFKDISVNLLNNELIINVVENPIIQNIIFNGIKSDSLREYVVNNTILKSRSSYIELFVERDISTMLTNLKTRGYYFSKINSKIEDLEENKLNIIYDIDLGEKSKIKKITFIGNKIFKDKKLKSVILSEEYKFWKFISGKKFLNEDLINFDKRLLKNFYLNNGYYEVEISSSFAKLINDNEFELVYNIDAGNKIYFGNLNLELPVDYDEKNFEDLTKILKKLETEPYSINSIEKIVEKIDIIALDEQYETIDVQVVESLIGNKLDLNFIVKETEKSFIQRINVLGNNITRENVIRNQFEIDEGDFYNEILYNKTINNLKSLNFFKTVEGKVSTDDDTNDKILDIYLEEKPTGEIGASAGVGTSGNSIGFFVKENNYLGKGLGLESNLTLGSDSIKGLISINNPNFNDTDKSVYATLEATEIDKLSDYGYKTNRTGFLYGTRFEFLDDFIFGLGNKNYYQKIETDNTASSLQQKQEGDYWDSFINLDFIYDKRNQKFKPTDGFRSSYSLELPVISETNTLSNIYDYRIYTELYDENVTSLAFYLKTSNSITNDDIKLSERNFLPGSKLRGFEAGSVGPKDGNDYIGGNYASSVNLSTTLPQILQENQNVDFLIFLDAGNVWGVDYDSSLSDSNKIRSAAGIGVDWLTPIGPLNFTLAKPITKSSTDATETFRFNLGTSF